MKSGEVVAVTSAGGGVGSFAVQFAKRAGNHVIAITSSDEKAEAVSELGADRVINYNREDLSAVLRAEYPEGIDLVFESVGGALFDTLLANLKVRGRLIVNGYISEYISGPQMVEAPRVYHNVLWQSRTVRGFLLPHYIDLFPAHAQRTLQTYFDGNLLSMVEPREFKGLESIPDAVELLYTGKNRGKIIISY